MKKNILICYDNFEIGGSTSSLLTFLDNIDYSSFAIDLYVYEKKGDFLKYLNPNVNVIEVKHKKTTKLRMLLYSIFTLKIFILFFSILFSKRKNKKRLFEIGKTQIGACYRARKSKKINKEYELGIGFLEFWSNEYVSIQNKIKKKIFWIHSDYLNSGMNLIFDKTKFNHAQKIVFVAEDCLKNFLLVSKGKYREKTLVVENVFNIKMIKSLSNMVIDDIRLQDEMLIYLSMFRMDSYTKGLDRVIEVAKELKKRNVKYKWYFLGDGRDLDAFLENIKDADLDNNLICLGNKSNPFCYLKKATALILLSRYEGKPMVVKEAQILGKCCIVTEYASAKSQIEHEKTGIICDNNEKFNVSNFVDEMLNLEKIKVIERNLKKLDFSKQPSIDQFNNILNGII